ncbi:N-glycosylase/DNA lyas-like protein [Dehalogenimonas sp. WBC-2]|nr:N-glycosylase/DNA lyas-like protein [Dehalogenimonas sp. WBC-2]
MIHTSIERLERVAWDISEETKNYFCDLGKWHNLSEEEIWAELVKCILASHVRWEHATSAWKHLYSLGYICSKFLVKQPDAEKIIVGELSKSIYEPMTAKGSGCKFRFPKTKTGQIIKSAIAIYTQGGSLKVNLNNATDDYDARTKLVNLCSGIGPKQASLFLRNIGYSHSLAIIDSHILKFLQIKGLVSNISKSPKDKRQYLQMEKTFVKYSQTVGIRPAHLDLAIWAVMRVSEVS